MFLFPVLVEVSYELCKIRLLFLLHKLVRLSSRHVIGQVVIKIHIITTLVIITIQLDY